MVDFIFSNHDLFFIGCSVFIGALIQTALGFGFGLICMPLLLLIGLDMASAVFFSMVISSFQTTIGSWGMRKFIPWSDVKFALWWRLMGLPAGMYLLYAVTHLPTSEMKQYMGGAILLLLVLRKVFPLNPRDHIPTFLSAVTFFISGFMAVAFGVGGPPLVLWSMMKKWSADQTRAFLLTSFTVSLPFSIIWLCFQFPSKVAPTFLNALILLPVLLLGTRSGFYIAGYLPIERLRLVTTIALTLLSLDFILEPLF